MAMNLKITSLLWPVVAGCGLFLATPAVKAADEASAKPTYEVDPLDWPAWRGPEQNGISRETGLIDSWDPKGGEGSNLLWKKEALAGRSTPIVMRGKLYTIVRSEPATPREGEMVVCADAATGEVLWENRFNVYLSDVPDTRVGWSCCVGDPTTGRVYALGVCGLFQCIDGDTGKTIWSHSLHEEYGLLSTYGGRTNTPILFEDKVLISSVVIGWDTMAKPAHRFMVFDKMTGEMDWFNGTSIAPYDTTYSTPMLTVFNGQAAMVFGSGDGKVWAMQPRTGKQIWSYEFSRRGLNVSPIVANNVVYAGHSEENVSGAAMGNVVAIDGAGVGDLAGKDLWSNLEMMVGKASPLYLDGRLYVVDDRAKLFVLDAKTGEQIAKQALGTVQRSSPIYADGKIYVCDNGGRFYILQPTEDGVKVLHKLRLEGESDGSPIVSHGRIYLPMSDAIYCLGQADHKPTADPIPPGPQEDPVSADPKPAQVQVRPCEVLLQPGEKQKFTVELFNAKGQSLGAAKEIAFSVKGSGEITAGGEYTASATGHDAAWITAKVGDIQGEARIRIVPPLPWKWDFDELDDLPITWVGGRVRYVIRKGEKGNQYIAKRDNIPTRPGQFTKLGTRSQAWFGPNDLSNYTIQADASCQVKEGKTPDLGLINQRYTLTLLGAAQKLQITSWVTQPNRMGKTVDFAWKPDTWYTLKLTTEQKDGQVIVRGKVWPRGAKEPTAWTIEAADEAPNLNGAPGIFGNSSDAEFYLDNLSVTPN